MAGIPSVAQMAAMTYVSATIFLGSKGILLPALTGNLVLSDILAVAAIAVLWNKRFY